MGPTVVLRPVTDVIERGQDAIVELYMDNLSLNEVVLTVDARVSMPSGLHVSSEGYAWAAAAGTAYAHFTVPPGTVRTISIHIQADKSARMGSHTLHFSGLYYPGENKDLYNPILLTYLIEVKEASEEIITATPAPTPTEASTPKQGIPGFEAILAMGAIAIIVLLLRKK